MRFALALLFASLGAAVGCGIVSSLLAGHSSISTWWLNTAGILPIGGAVGACALAAHRNGSEWPLTGLPRFAYTLLGAAIAGLACYLAFVITARAVVPDKFPGGASLIDSALSPFSLPSLGSTRSGSPTSSEVTGVEEWITGSVGGGVLAWWTLGGQRWKA